MSPCHGVTSCLQKNISSPPIGIPSSPPLSRRRCRPALFLPLCRCSASHSAAPPHRLHRRCALSSACSAPSCGGETATRPHFSPSRSRTRMRRPPPSTSTPPRLSCLRPPSAYFYSYSSPSASAYNGWTRPPARRTSASTPERLVPLGTARCRRRIVAGLVSRRNPAMLLPKGPMLEVRSSSRSPSTPPSNSSSFLPRGCLPPPPADPAPPRLLYDFVRFLHSPLIHAYISL